MQLGKIDFADMVDRMYTAIEKQRYDALYTAFTTLDASLPTDLILDTPVTAATMGDIVEHIEAVKAASGYDVTLIGSRTAIQKLQSTVSYNMYSGNMKDERNQNGVLANWEGYECLPISRVNKAGTRTNILDNTKILIVPNDPEFKPLIRVNEGDVAYFESGMDGLKKDMTVDAELVYREGVGVVVNEMFGEIKIQP